MNAKELPHNTGYLRKALKTVSAGLMGEELRGFALKVRFALKVQHMQLLIYNCWDDGLGQTGCSTLWFVGMYNRLMLRSLPVYQVRLDRCPCLVLP